MIVTAKRLGWDEELTVEQSFDHDPYDYEDDDLQGELVEFTSSSFGGFTICLVGGQEADPKTVKAVEPGDEADSEFKWDKQPRVPAGHGGGGQWGSEGAKSVVKGGKHTWKYPKGHPKNPKKTPASKPKPVVPSMAAAKPLTIPTGKSTEELAFQSANWVPGEELAGQAGKLDTVQRDDMTTYSGSEYENINGQLRDPPPDSDVARIAGSISAGIQTHGELKEPMTAYRGMSFKTPEEQAAFISGLTEGGEFQNKGFYSTSTDAKQALGFTTKHGVMFEIKAKKGLFMDGLSQYATEREFLMDHGSRFKIQGIKKKYRYGGDGKTDYLVIQMEQLH